MATGDQALVAQLLPLLDDSIEHHVRGTRFNIGVDPSDGLLRQGADGYQFTWMDAKMGDWVVTPRRGKAVEINALWYNALRLTAAWHARAGNRRTRRRRSTRPRSARGHSFNRRFWSESAGHLFDVVDGPDGDDPACRPNQVLAIALTHPVLAEGTLGPGDGRSLSIDCSRRSDFDRSILDTRTSSRRIMATLRTRDGAYHQGTVWAWLIGPFVDAWIRLHPDRPESARIVPQLAFCRT